MSSQVSLNEADWPGRVWAWVSSPTTQTNVLQLLKAALAAVTAWVLAELVLELEQGYMAPWVALLTVHATIHRTMWCGIQTLFTVGLGIVVSLLIVEVFDISPWSFALALLIGLALSQVPLLHDESITIATTVLFVLTTGYNMPEQRAIDLLPDRLLGAAIGVAVALLVNVLVLPPLNDRSAQRQIDDVENELGVLLVDISWQLRGPREVQEHSDWIERTRSIAADLQDAWSLVRTAQESRWWNPRRRLQSEEHLASFPQVLMRMEEGVAQTRNIARQLRESNHASQEWDPRFRARYIDLLETAGHRIAEPGCDVAPLREGLRQLADDLSTEDLSGLLWPLYGSLIASLQIIIDVVDDVATAPSMRTDQSRTLKTSPNGAHPSSRGQVKDLITRVHPTG